MIDYEIAQAIFEYVKAAAIVTSPFLVIGGWLYVNRTNNQRESRKELHTLIKDFNEFADTLTELGVEYLNCDGIKRSKTLRLNILRQDRVLAAMHANICSVMDTDSQNDCIKYRGSLTATFDDAEKRVCDEESEEMKNLYMNLCNLKIKLLDEFYSQIPIKNKK